MKKNKDYFWIDPDKTQQLIEARDPQYSVGFMVLVTYVDDRGKMSFQKAIDGLLAAFSDIDKPQAEALLARFAEAGLAIIDDQTVTLPGYGTAFTLNQPHKEAGPGTR